MYPQYVPYVFLWIGFCITTQQAMDVQKELIGWLDEVTLFSPTKQQQQHFEDEDPFKLCFDDLIGSTDPQKQKIHDEALIDLPDVSDILVDDGWMDEKIDLSILDASHEWLEQPNADEKYVADARGESDMVVASYMDYLLASSDTIQPLKQIGPESPNGSSIFLAHDAASDSVSEVAISSPGAVPLEFVPLEVGLQSPISPAASFSSGASSSTGIPSPFSIEPTLDGSDAGVTVDSQCPVGYFVEVDSQAAHHAASPPARASTSSSPVPDKLPKGRERRSHKETSQLRKSQKSAAQSRHPYRQPKTESRYERKKVQNKEAAARYRVKKKEQDQVLSDEVASLEAEQEKLREKHDKLKSEVTYLKSLLKELFQARGLIKK